MSTQINLKVFLFSLFVFEERGREEERERSTNVWLPVTCPPPGTWSSPQACVLTENRTSDPLVRRLVLNRLSHIAAGQINLMVLICLGLPFKFLNLLTVDKRLKGSSSVLVHSSYSYDFCYSTPIPCFCSPVRELYCMKVMMMMMMMVMTVIN